MNGSIMLHPDKLRLKASVHAELNTLDIEFWPPGGVCDEMEIVIFDHSIDEIRAFGQSIVDACVKITPPSALEQMSRGEPADPDQAIAEIAAAEAQHREMAVEELDRR